MLAIDAESESFWGEGLMASSGLFIFFLSFGGGDRPLDDAWSEELSSVLPSPLLSCSDVDSFSF